MVAPDQLRYTPTHEWAHTEKAADGTSLVTVGITAYALEALTDLVYIDLPETGRQVKAGQPFGEVESVKAVSELYSPVDGEIVESNTAIVNNLEQLSKDPYQSGWLVKIKPSDPSQLEKLLDYAAYRKLCEENPLH
jgi:glycine cleavage system H protein